MPKFLFEARYTPEGVKGLLKEGGSKRRDAVDQLARSLGGRMEAFHYALGDNDAIVIVDLPDLASAVAVSNAVNASGVVTGKTVQLISPQEMDEAIRKNPQYRAPGT
jgi:uncharacterized protein with GYD domain